nr:MFS transporter [Pseudomonas sp. WPR_5_2]
MITKRIRKARVATFLGFILLGGLMYTWSTGVSAFREQLGLGGDAGDIDFGIVALMIGIGSAVGSLVIGKIIDSFGPKAAVTLCIILYPASIIPMGLVSNVHYALGFGAVLGLFRGALDTALNAHGIQVERFYNRPILAAFHACYALGGFLLGIVGSWLSSIYTESAAVQFSVLGGATLVIGILLSRWLLDKGEAPAWTQRSATLLTTSTSGKVDTKFAVIVVMLGFGFLLLAAMIGESAIADWGQEFVRREFMTTASIAGIAVSTFTGAEFIGRMLGDRLAGHFGPRQVVFVGSLIAISGLSLSILGRSSVTSIAGFGLFGLGISCIAPLMLSAAGAYDPDNCGRNIGIVNCIGYSGMLIAPAAITTIVNYFGLGKLMYFPLGMIGLLAMFAPLLMRGKHKLPASEVKCNADPRNVSIKPA